MNIVDRIISPNIWDEERELGSINYRTGAKVDSDNRIKSKNYIRVIANTTYYFKAPTNTALLYAYDIDKNYIGAWVNGNFWVKDGVDYISNKQFTTPNNCYYIQFSLTSSYGTTYNHDICINESNPSINGKYFPYVMYKRYDIVDKPIYELPEGYIPTDIEVGGSYGVVDLGTLTWSWNSANSYWQASANLGQKQNLGSKTPNGLSTNYLMGSYDNYIYNGRGKNYLFYNSTSFYVSNQDLTKSPTGILFYERSTPASPTLVKGNELNKYCIYNGQIGVYGDTFKYNSNIPLKQWLKRLKIGG